MKKFEKVQGSKEASRELIVDEGNIVYVHSNIRRIPIEELRERNPEATDEQLSQTELYEYDEIQYTKEEYIEILTNKNKALEEQTTDLQIALTDLYESVGV